MSKNVWVILFVGLFISCATDAQKNGTVKNIQEETAYPYQLLQDFEGHPIVFYNVENLFDTLDSPGINDEEYTPSSKKEWNTAKYNDKLDKLAKAITTPKNNRPLLVGLCEVENTHVVRDLILTAPLNASKYRIAHFDSPDGRGIDVALAYDLERFYVLHQEAVPVVFMDPTERPTRDILYVKGLLKDSLELHVFVNHWPSRYGGEEASRPKRERAAIALRHKTDSILNVQPTANILIMGDLNDHPNNVAVELTLGAKHPVKSPESSLLNLQYPAHDRGEGTYNYKGEWGILDHIIVSNNLYQGKNKLKVKPQVSHIVYEEFLLYKNKDGQASPSRTYGGDKYFGGYSDHLPIYLYLQRTN
jgi:predicted extracellular nuclease